MSASLYFVKGAAMSRLSKRRETIGGVALVWFAGLLASAQPGPEKIPEPQREDVDKKKEDVKERQLLSFRFDKDTPAREMVPAVGKLPTWRLNDDLDRVPELSYLSPSDYGAANVPPQSRANQAERAIARTLSQARHLDRRKTEGFLDAVIENRPDLRGLPFLRGGACRMSAEMRTFFPLEAAAMRGTSNTDFLDGAVRLRMSGEVAREELLQLALIQGKARSSGPQSPPFATPASPGTPGSLAKIPDNWSVKSEANLLARVRADMQILCLDNRMALVSELQAIPHPETTACLAKMALFSPEASVRKAAALALGVRRERDYDTMLLAGFRYPLPAIADHAAETVINLKRFDLLPRIVDVLDQPDPREPAAPTDNRPATARELVKINHHRNCMLCHAPHPANPNERVADVPAPNLLAKVPNPREPMNSASPYESQAPIDLAIRIDVTYLRQDFSLLLPVANSDPWPEMQRFDFVINTRTLTPEEWAAFQGEVKNRPRGYIAPHHRAALRVLREMTGLDTAPTAAAWRPLVDDVLASRK
jgi:hypothetical protein